MDPESHRRRAIAAVLLLCCLVLMLGVAAVRNPPAAGGARGNPWAAAFRNALIGVSGPNPLGPDAGATAVGKMLPGRPVLPPESPGELGSPGAGAPRGGPPEGVVGAAGPECDAQSADCVKEAGGRAAGLAAAHAHGPGGASASGSGSSSFESLGGGSSSGAGGLSGAGAGGGPAAGGRRVKAEDVAQVFNNFIQRLRHEAAAQAHAQRGSAPPQAQHAAGGYNRNEALPAGVPSAEDSPLMASPSFRNLMNVGRDAHFGVQLYEKGMTDGAKDKAGKEFDGNLKTRATIPIERTQGAFGQETIRAKGKTADPGP